MRYYALSLFYSHIYIFKVFTYILFWIIHTQKNTILDKVQVQYSYGSNRTKMGRNFTHIKKRV